MKIEINKQSTSRKRMTQDVLITSSSDGLYVIDRQQNEVHLITESKDGNHNLITSISCEDFLKIAKGIEARGL